MIAKQVQVPEMQENAKPSTANLTPIAEIVQPGFFIIITTDAGMARYRPKCLARATYRLFSGLKQSQVPGMMELLSFTGKAEVRAVPYPAA